MAPDAVLPDRCVKTDLPAGGATVDVALLWHEPAVYWLLVLNPIVYLVVARAVGTRVVVTRAGDAGGARGRPAAPRGSRGAARGRSGLLARRRAARPRRVLLARRRRSWPLAIPVYLLGARFLRVKRLGGRARLDRRREHQLPRPPPQVVRQTSRLTRAPGLPPGEGVVHPAPTPRRHTSVPRSRGARAPRCGRNLLAVASKGYGARGYDARHIASWLAPRRASGPRRAGSAAHVARGVRAA